MNDEVLYDEEMQSDEQLQMLARRLLHTKAVDPDKGALCVRIYRERVVSSTSQKALYAITCNDLAKQIVLGKETGTYMHARDYDGSEDIMWLTGEQWRGIFAATILGTQTVPAPDDASAIIMLLRSTKRLSRKQLNDAITLAHAFGDARDVSWTPPKKKEPTNETDHGSTDDVDEPEYPPGEEGG